MKNLLFGLIATVLFSLSGNAQTTSRVKLFCITTSCCGIGPFSIEIYHQTTCHYVSSNKMVANLTSSTRDQLSFVEVKDDVLLAGFFAENGDNLLLPAGKYPVNNGQIEFTPTTMKAKTYCWEIETSGDIFGHEFHQSIKFCVTLGNAAKGVVTINPKLDSKQLEEILNSKDKSIYLKEDIALKEDGINYTLKAGKYIINEDGNAYIENALLNK